MSDGKNSSGAGFSGLLTIVFIVLKLTKVIEWPWLWVLSPLWIDLGIFIILEVILCILDSLLT